MRGKEGDLVPIYLDEGITPAYAGKSSSMSRCRSSSGDHPRVCGEKTYALKYYLFEKGSPPRMRGKVCHGRVVAEDPGITPAYAGKS